MHKSRRNVELVRVNELKPFVMMYEGHDVSLAFWLPKTNDWVIYELERVTGEKHFSISRGFANLFNNGPYTVNRLNKGRVNDIVKFCLANLKKDFGIDNDFQTLYIMPVHATPMGEYSSWDYDILNAPSWHRVRMNHHEGHQWSAYMQAPFDKCSCISWDAGGDNTLFMYGEFENGTMTKRFEYPILRASFMWQILGSYMKTIQPTPNALDYAGKMMGLSAYGKKNLERAEQLIPRIHWWMTNQIPKDECRDSVRDWCKEEFGTVLVDGEDEQTLAYAIQLATERLFIELLENEFIDDIRKTGNLIITGGTAMNILVNEAVKRHFPDISVFVPCNPGDDGISCGFLSREFAFLEYEQFGRHVVEGNYDFKYAGPYLFDCDSLPNYVRDRNGKQTTLRDVAGLLKEGKIIGFLNGRSEIGPRSLGNRSILCDPSQPNMKDTLNAKVKFREWYRPFAPVCKLEDADKYFDSRDYEMMDAMQFGIEVKPEWRDHLTEITHEDGSARLQTVTTESNPVFYELLDEFDGVLLNTSFNVQGKPILNSIRDAMHILDNTELDYVVVVDKETNIPYIFE